MMRLFVVAMGKNGKLPIGGTLLGRDKYVSQKGFGNGLTCR
jgi:hypothetical protein